MNALSRAITRAEIKRLKVEIDEELSHYEENRKRWIKSCDECINGIEKMLLRLNKNSLAL